MSASEKQILKKNGSGGQSRGVGRPVLYNISHYAYISPVILHKKLFHDGQDAVLLMDSGWFSQETKDFMKNHGFKVPFFGHCYEYCESALKVAKDEDNLEKNISKFFDKALQDVGYNLSDFSEIYSGFDRIHAFGIYLSYNCIKHNLFDINTLTQLPDDFLLGRKDAYSHLLAKHKALRGDSPLVKKVIYTTTQCDIRSQIIEYNLSNKGILPERKNVFFSVSDSVALLKDEDKKELASFFEISTEDCGKRNTILFTTSNFFLHTTGLYEKYRGIMGRGETFLYPYRILLDYLFEGSPEDLIIKTHPNTIIAKKLKDEYFPGVMYLPGYVPSELLKLFDLKISTTISPGSNAALTYEADRTIALPRSYFDHFESLHSLSLSLCLSKYLEMKKVFVDTNMPESLSKPLLSQISSKNMHNLVADIKYADCIVLDMTGMCPEDIEKSVETRNTRKCLIAFGKGTEFSKIYDGASVIKIEKERKSSRSVCDIEDEYIYIFANKKLCNKLKSFCGTKNLNYSDMILRYHTIETYEAFRRVPNRSNDLDRIFEAAEKGNALSQYNLYLMYKTGKGVEKSDDNAIGWLRRSCIVNKERRLEYCDALMKRDMPGDTGVAFLLNKELSEEGNPDAMIRLSGMYRDGKGVDKDIDRAIEWMAKVADEDIGWAKNELVDLLLKRGTGSDIEEAFGICSQSAATGDVGAMGRLGRMYRDGKGVDKDIDRAIEWMTKAADRGIAWAKNELSNMNGN